MLYSLHRNTQFFTLNRESEHLWSPRTLSHHHGHLIYPLYKTTRVLSFSTKTLETTCAVANGDGPGLEFCFPLSRFCPVGSRPLWPWWHGGLIFPTASGFQDTSLDCNSLPFKKSLDYFHLNTSHIFWLTKQLICHFSLHSQSLIGTFSSLFPKVGQFSLLKNPADKPREVTSTHPPYMVGPSTHLQGNL